MKTEKRPTNLDVANPEDVPMVLKIAADIFRESASELAAACYGMGVLLRARSSTPLDGGTFATLARQGWRIECSSQQEQRRVAGALAWASLGLPDEALVVRNPEDMEKEPYPSF